MHAHKNTIMALLLLAGSTIPAGALAELKIAFVEVNRLLKDAPQVQEVRDRIKGEFARRDDELVSQQKQLKKPLYCF